VNIGYLKDFIELAQCLNFTEASARLNLTQPALSKHILALEREFDIELLDRSRKGARLTEAGRVLFENAGIIVDIYDNTKKTLGIMKTEKPIRVVGHLDDSDIASLVSTIAMLARNNHHATVTFTNAAAAKPFESIKNNTADIFIGFIDPQHIEEAGLDFEKFLEVDLIAIVGSTHPFADWEYVHLKDLKNETFIRFVGEKTNCAWGQIEKMCIASGFIPRTRPISSQNDVEFFSAPLHGSVLIWKKSQRQIKLLLETGRRSSIPIIDDSAVLTIYTAFRPGDRERLAGFFEAVEETKTLLNAHKNKRRTSIAFD
jgi:DNA-binding transcriptional LysR family regulator